MLIGHQRAMVAHTSDIPGETAQTGAWQADLGSGKRQIFKRKMIRIPLTELLKPLKCHLPILASGLKIAA